MPPAALPPAVPLDIAAQAARLAALGSEQRLAVFRALMSAMPEPMSAGALSEAVGLSPSALSFHLKELVHQRLLNRVRDGRNILYTVDVETMRDLMRFLSQDCCDGHPEICGVLDPFTSKAKGKCS